jgi:hypothetical protein
VTTFTPPGGSREKVVAAPEFFADTCSRYCPGATSTAVAVSPALLALMAEMASARVPVPPTAMLLVVPPEVTEIEVVP